MFKVNNKDTRIRKVNDRVKNKDTVDVVLASLLLTLNALCLLESSKMHKNTCGRVTFLVNLMFSRLDRFDGPIFGGGHIRGAYIWDVNWVTYLVGLYTGAY